MAPIKLTGVVSCNSEDAVSCAKNLLISDSFKKWTTEKPGVAKASVILKLESEQHVTGLDIGNNGSAFIEVLVANSASETEFENLILTSSFMTPSESKSQTNQHKIRMFGKDELCKGAVNKKWDRVKIVCTQPYNKAVPYGISVITVQGIKKTANPDPIIQVAQPKPMTKSPAPAKKAEPSESKEGKAASSLLSKLQKQKDSNESLKRLKETGGTSFSSKTVVDISDDVPSSPKTPKNKPVRSEQQTPGSSRSRSDFSSLLKDVVFVLSGFQNPLRSDIRDIGLSMGGKYRPDWSSDSTHLICAMSNTPKFNQVKGKGIIVRKEWFFDCKKEKRKVSEHKYRLDSPPNSDSDDSDAGPGTNVGVMLGKRKQTGNVNYADRDEESEESSQKKRRKTKDDDDEYVPESQGLSSDDEDVVELNDSDKEVITTTRNNPVLEISSEDEEEEPVPSKADLPDISDSEDETKPDVFEVDTDEETEDDVIKRLGLPPLPNFFSGHKFFIDSVSFDEYDEVKKIERYAIAYGGKIFDHMSQEVKFIITKNKSWSSNFKQALAVNPKVKFINNRWFEKCCDAVSAVSKDSYYLNNDLN